MNVIEMSDEEFARIYSYLKTGYGIDMAGKKSIVSGRLENYLRTEGFHSYSQFMNAVENDYTGELERILVNSLTTNHTYFMREFEHFDYLKSVVLPWLKVKEARSRDLRIWCGAASTGEEPYTIAMVMKDFFGLEADRWDTKVLATDVSTEALQQAIRGVYSAERVQDLPETWRRRFFRQVPHTGEMAVTDELKQEVLFRKFNLMDPFPFRGLLHVVFLRNVMIYFDAPTKRELLQKIYDVMAPGGYLFIGLTETVNRDVIPFVNVRPSIYRKPE